MKRDPKLVGHSREMRHTSAPAEAVMWKLLRDRRLAGFKFRRQHPIEPYIADFYCAAALVVVELDGDTHVGQETRDQSRDEHFRRLGLMVLRFWNPQVYDESDAVVEDVYRVCASRVNELGTHPRHDGARHWKRRSGDAGSG